MASFAAPLAQAERELALVRKMQSELQSGWRDQTGRQFLQATVDPVVQRLAQIVENLRALEDLARQSRTF